MAGLSARKLGVTALLLAAIPLAPMAVAGDRLLTLYAGKYTDRSLGNLFSRFPIRYEDAYILAIAPGWVLTPQSGDRHRWEFETQAVKHFGLQTHWEFNFALLWRWRQFPWNHRLATTLGIGDGLSYALAIPPLEAISPTNRGATRLLNYIVLELTLAARPEQPWQWVIRVHHRSGVYGIFDNVSGGSNVVSAGVKFRL